MSRDGLVRSLCALCLCGLLTPASAAPPDDREARFTTLLAVQRALQDGRDHLQRGNYQAAVDVLESQVSRIDGSAEYLNTLREAYRALIREMQKGDRAADAQVYARRLQILDPGSAYSGESRAALQAPIAPTVKQIADERPAPATLAQLAQTQTGGPRPIKANGKIDDPAEHVPADHVGRSARADDAQAILARAETEFSGRNYAAAGKLFEQVSRLDSSLVAPARERWAYCKVFGVVDALNRAEVNDQNCRAYEQEVRLAMSMSKSAELGGFGKDLLRKIQERTSAGSTTPDNAPAVEVRHTPARGQGWALAETTNFRIFHRQPREVAERVARIAEQTRYSMSKKWFGDDGGKWSPSCELFLHATGQDYARATGVPAGSPGHSTIRSEGARVLSRRIDLHCDDPNMCIGVLPHETTHVVLAGRFGDSAVPRWADEGMAVLSEPRDRIDRHLRNLPRHNEAHQLFGVGQLMRLNDYPDPRYIGPFYAQSVSLVEFLSREKGPRVFADFLRDGLRGGYEPALERHYGIQGFNELETRWRQAALPTTSPALAGAR